MLIHPDCGGEELCGCLGDSRRDVADEGWGMGLNGPILLWHGCWSEQVLPLAGPFILVTGTAWLAAGAG